MWVFDIFPRSSSHLGDRMAKYFSSKLMCYVSPPSCCFTQASTSKLPPLVKIGEVLAKLERATFGPPNMCIGAFVHGRFSEGEGISQTIFWAIFRGRGRRREAFVLTEILRIPRSAAAAAAVISRGARARRETRKWRVSCSRSVGRA